MGKSISRRDCKHGMSKLGPCIKRVNNKRILIYGVSCCYCGKVLCDKTLR